LVTVSTTIGPPLCAQDTIDTLGELTINGISMHIDGSWNVLNPQVLWTPNAVKGENRPKPRVAGSRANRWRIAQGQYSLLMMIDGAWDVDNGVFAGSSWVGLQHNIEYLMRHVVLPPTSAETRAASLVMPDGDTRTGAVQPRLLEHEGTELDAFNAVLTLWVPGGYLPPSGGS